MAETNFIRDSIGNDTLAPFMQYAFENHSEFVSELIFQLGVNGLDTQVINHYTFNQFELSNHLGNVLATILDRRTLHDTTIYNSGNDTAALWDADIVSAQDYYAFGMLLPNRIYSADSTGSGGSRYGFNGMERDDEWNGAGNAYDFGARIYDARIGRWYARDPMEAKYPSRSPYKAFKNNPLIYIDPNGKEEYLTIIVQTNDGSELVVKRRVSDKVMTDGKKHWVQETIFFGLIEVDNTYQENRYYDFNRVITRTQNEDGTWSEEETVEIMTDGPVRERDGVFGEGEDKGDIIDPWNGLWGDGSSQPSGWNLVSASGGVEQTKAEATEDGVEIIDIGPILDAFGALGKTPRSLPSIKSALGSAEFANTMKDLEQSLLEMFEEYADANDNIELENSNNKWKCTNEGCDTETNDSTANMEENPYHNLELKNDTTQKK